MTNQVTLRRPMFTLTAMPNRPTSNFAGRSTNKGIIFRHMQFVSSLGSASVTVRKAGYWVTPSGKIKRKPIFIFCDPLSIDAGGLTPASGTTYEVAKLVTHHVVTNDMLLAIVADAHVDENHVNNDAISDVAIEVDYYLQLTDDEKSRADLYFVAKMEIPSYSDRKALMLAAQKPGATPDQKLRGERWIRYEREGKQFPDAGQPAQYLTVQELIILHGIASDSQGNALMDGEFRPFLFGFQHCVEPTETGGKSLYRWIPFISELLQNVMQANSTANKNGDTAPDTRVLVIHKNDLRPSVANGARGTDGNLLEEILHASQYGHPQGPEHDDERHVIIYGNGTPYTVLYSILNNFALGFRVTLLLPATFHFEAAGFSMLELVRALRHMFPYAFEAKMFWDEELMGGPEPVARNGQTYNQLAAEAQAELEASWRASGGANLNMSFYAFSDPNDLRPVISDWSL